MSSPRYDRTRVLVTGADGFIGSHLVEHLVALGADVTALALYNSFDSAGWLDEVPREVQSRVRVVRGDVRDRGFMQRLINGHEVVFHLAALIAIPYSYEAAQLYVDVNVTGTLNVLEAAREAKVGRVVHTSTSEVYGSALHEPIDEAHPLQGQSPYSASKIGGDMMAEAFARSHDVPVVLLRPFNTYGPRQSERAVVPTIVRQALDPTCGEIRLGTLHAKRDLCFVGDTAAAFAAVGRASGLSYGVPYNAGTGRSVSVGQVAELVRRLTGTSKPVVQEEARVRPINSEVRSLLADSTRLTAATGWRPGVDLETGLARTIEWWRGRIESNRVRRSAGYAT